MRPYKLSYDKTAFPWTRNTEEYWVSARHMPCWQVAACSTVRPYRRAHGKVLSIVMPWMSEMDLPSLQLQSCFHLRLGWRITFHVFLPLWPWWPSHMNMTWPWLWRRTCVAKIDFLGQLFQKLLYYRQMWPKLLGYFAGDKNNIFIQWQLASCLKTVYNKITF